MREDRVKHLELIQAVITRMAGNSFLLKGWNVTLTAALLALAAGNGKVAYAVVALAPGVSFWALDAYYLKLERQYRGLYNEVRKEILADAPIKDLYSLDASAFASQVPGFWRTCVSVSVGLLHGAVVIATITAILVVGVGELYG